MLCIPRSGDLKMLQVFAESPAFQSFRMQQHIFLIEDDDSLRQSLEALLRFSGYHVVSFSDPASFLSTTIQVAPAIVITDMRLPGMSGVEMQKVLLSRGRRIPVVFISAESTLSQGVTAMKQGAVDFLIKPFDREELLAVVTRAMQQDIKQFREFVQKNQLDQALTSLSNREKQVFGLLIKGFDNQKIMEALGIGLHTTKQYKSEVMRKLGVSSLADLLRLSNEAQSPD